ncbi:uncharacterized protein BYT42DRAFT_554101 [Radiomyces spectabilis]|uniref:uncharacterized protein n=1 Tax=Radiomyces spectabilis TaxID=64574 RepID=UPI00221F9BD8|nr:uncharacterized protein BYT42DRAFT_554101 [Radiomyces spectabilis]KAI8394288.1 hypothetical protein BYT42DRAFT_554101 [Radiomyces spectabilis]
MLNPIRLNHRHQPSTSSTGSSASSSSSTRPALPQILTHSASNAVHISRSTAPTSRRVRSHWFTHFALNWRRSSRASKFILSFSMTLVAVQIIASAAVLTFSWDAYCDKPLRVFIVVYILRLILSSPLSIYLHLIPSRRQTTNNIMRAEQGESYIMTERTSVPNPIPPTNPSLPAFAPSTITSARPALPSITNPMAANDTTLTAWIDRAKSALDLFAVLWFVIGNYMIFTSNTCSETAVSLYYLSLAIIVYGYIIITVPILLCTSVIFCLPCVLVGMRLLHVSEGIDMGGATSEEIARIPCYRFKKDRATSVSNLSHPSERPNLPETDLELHTIPSETALKNLPNPPLGFLDKLWLRLGLTEPSGRTDESDYEELKISNEQDQVCAICLSTYEDGDILCRLWCMHHFHKACVHEWLALNSRCPMCKRDSRGKDSPLNTV